MDSTQHSVSSSPTSYSSSERDANANNVATGASMSSSGIIGKPIGAPASTPTTPGASQSVAPGSPWGGLPSRKPIGSGAIGAERNASSSSGSASVNSAIAGGDWFPAIKNSAAESRFPGFERRLPREGNSDGLNIDTALQTNSGPPSRSVSTTGLAIGSERRQVSDNRTSRPASPSVSLSSLQQQRPNSVSIPPSSFLGPSIAAPLGPGVGAPPTPNSQTAPGSNVASTPSELESAFDAMLRGSSLFQEVQNRLGNLESQVHQLISHSLNTPSSAQANGHFDLTPTRSPSVSAASGTGSYLTAPNSSRPHSLFLSNTTPNSVVSTALHSPSLSQTNTEPSTPSLYGREQAGNNSSDRDIILQLTAQLSALGNNVAHLMAQQGPQPPAAITTPGITPSGTPNPGNWPFDGHHGPMNHGHNHNHGPHGPPSHPALNRPNLSGLRATSYDIPRGAALPRGSAAAAAAYEERESRKRSQLTLQAPTPMGMGARRHSADVVENMHAAAEGMSGPGGNQSLLGKWEALGVTGDLLRAIVKYGIGPPSKIQMKAIPCVLNTQDIVAQASSIQERIQCYVIPALQHVYAMLANAAIATLNDKSAESIAPKGVQVLILTATIDQAGQAHRMCLGLGQQLGISSSLVVGQGDVSSELASLSANPPHILVGTPQKLLDLLAIRSIQVDKLSLLIIDEMDQLIARNLSEFVNNLARLLPPPISNAPNSRDRSPAPGSNGFMPFEKASTSPTRVQERQTAIFSCTVPQEVLNFASALGLREPVRVLVRRENNQETPNVQTPSLRGMKHFFLYLAMGHGGPSGTRTPGSRQDPNGQNREWKLEALADLCSDADFSQGVVYCSSIDSVEAVSYKLVSRNIDAYALHGDMGQSARHAIVNKFRSGNTGNRNTGMKRVLVVYDALCRTLSDIHQVALVINFDLPRAVEDYVHRVACAASSGYGRAGSSVNMVSGPADIEMLRAIESFYRLKINELPPSLNNIC